MNPLAGETGFSVADREERLVWIFGSSRSGSTWLLRMLSELGGAVAVDDPHLGHHLGVWRPIPLAWAAAEAQPDLSTLLDVKADKPGYFFAERYRGAWEPALRELIVARFDAQAREALQGERSSDPLIVVKEPGSHVAELLLELFPRSMLIFLIRDGRDVVDSWVAAHTGGSWAQGEGAFPLADHGREAFVRWQAAVWAYRIEAVQRAYAGHPADQRIAIRYEDLLRDPVTALERICRRIAADPGRLELERIASRHAFDSVPETEKGDRKEIRAARPGGWRENLTRSEQRAMIDVMGTKLAELGYLARYASRAA